MSIRIKISWVATSLWIILWTVFLYSDWTNAKNMGFNEWGDFFAGAFAPLAFLWLVIGYFQQGEELSQNTRALEQQEEALKLQVEELRQSVEQQNKSATAQNRQAKISGLMARLDAANHIMDSLERQKIRISTKAISGKITKSLEEKQEKHEASMERLLAKLEELEEASND